MIALSPGVAFGCIELLGAVRRNSLNSGGVLTLALGSVQSKIIYDAAVDLRWVELGPDGTLTLTVRGVKALSGHNDQMRLRSLIIDYIDIEQPPWLQLAPAGRRETLMQAPAGVRQILAEAGLAYGDDDETVGFWDALAARARGLRDSARLEIGRRGERLTIARELERTGIKPIWIALESSTDGYDVLSRVSTTDGRRLAIEVKASERPLGLASFHLTRKEWETAETSLNHAFHLWDLSSDPPRLAVLTVDNVSVHVPDDQGEGAWESVLVPFSPFFS